MIRIRYSELPAGLHVTADSDSRGTVIYLLPGLTPAQRRTALMRVRSSARMGQGPALPVPAMAAAIAGDRVRTAAGYCAAAMRGHPVLLLPPVIAVVVSAIVFMLISAVPATIPPHQVAASLPTLAIDGSTAHAARHHHREGPRARHRHGLRRHGLAGSAGLRSLRHSRLSGLPAWAPSPERATSSPGPSSASPGPTSLAPEPGSPSPSPTPAPSPG